VPNAQSLVVSITNNTVNPAVTTVLVGGQYTVLSGIGNTYEFITGAGNGGIISYNPPGGPLPSGWSITIQRIVTPVQATSLSNQGAMYPNVIEGALDYLTMLQQQTNDAALLGTSPNMMSMISALGIGGGSWTPALQFGSHTTGIAYTTQVGEYVTIGKLCIAAFYIYLSSAGSASGNATIGGLPFAAQSVTGGGGVVGSNNMASLTAPVIISANATLTTAALMYQGATQTLPITNSNFTNTSILDGVLAYFTG
jgi:hypothetical protein